jgi:hypothetical protein
MCHRHLTFKKSSACGHSILTEERQVDCEDPECYNSSVHPPDCAARSGRARCWCRRYYTYVSCPPHIALLIVLTTSANRNALLNQAWYYFYPMLLRHLHSHSNPSTVAKQMSDMCLSIFIIDLSSSLSSSCPFALCCSVIRGPSCIVTSVLLYIQVNLTQHPV